MRFLADTGVSQRVVAWLCEQGHDATHLREENLHRLPNGEIFQKALGEERIILTFDLDFAEIAALSGGKAASVIVFRLRNARISNVGSTHRSAEVPKWLGLERLALRDWHERFSRRE